VYLKVALTKLKELRFILCARLIALNKNNDRGVCIFRVSEESSSDTQWRIERAAIQTPRITKMHKERIMKIAATLVVLAGIASVASADVYVSEIYGGLSGEDGTNDWFEVTYNGAGTFDTGTLFYEDDSADPTNAGAMTSFILSSGESAVFVLGADATDLATFASIWGAVVNLGSADGGGNLGQSGDGVFLYDGNSAGATLVTSQSFTGDHNTTLATWEFDALGNAQYSVDGVNGAYTSASFFNDNLGAPNDSIALIGSPGAVPTPGTVALLAVGGLVGTRRRR
jgi:hypothetical protein